eukprot:3100509-Karenia_brevis.AAC.1
MEHNNFNKAKCRNAACPGVNPYHKLLTPKTQDSPLPSLPPSSLWASTPTSLYQASPTVAAPTQAQ